MRLLFDHNLSPRLVKKFADLYPNSQHLFSIEMARDEDQVIWEYALHQNSQPNLQI
jgi:predicted nuclease of predicted toxin-antitoxin system